MTVPYRRTPAPRWAHAREARLREIVTSAGFATLRRRPALQAGRVGRDVAGPGELGIDLLPVPDVTALGAIGLGGLLALPERQRGQLGQPLVVVRDIGRGKGLALVPPDIRVMRY